MILSRLKHETATAHAATERIVDITSRLRSPEDYRRLLAAFWGFYAPFEAHLAARPELRLLQPALEERAHTPRLARDLAALGMAPAAIDRLPRCAALPHLPSYQHLLGGWYVLEGATLGGQVVARLVRGALGMLPDRGSAFFSGYGPLTGPMWRSFGTLLVVAAGDIASEDAIVDGANATFATFGSWVASEKSEALP